MNTSDFLVDDSLLEAMNRRIGAGGRGQSTGLFECFERFPGFPIVLVQFSQTVTDVSRSWKQSDSAVHDRFGFSHQLSLEEDDTQRRVQSFTERCAIESFVKLCSCFCKLRILKVRERKQSREAI